MIDNQIFAWGNYEEDPKNIMGVDTIPTQKNATYTDSANGVFTGNLEESFFTNIDKSLVSNPAAVNGMEAGDIVYGSKDGIVMVNKTYEFTSWSAATEGTKYGDGKAKVINTEDTKTYVQVLENSESEWVNRVFWVDNTITEGRLQLNDASTDTPIDVWIELNA